MNDILLYKLIKVIIAVVGKLPRVVLGFCSDVLGLIWFNIDKRHRAVVIKNIQSAYPGKYSRSQAVLFAKKNFQHTTSLIFDAVWSYGQKKKKLLEYYEIRGAEHILDAMKKGGVILLGGHIGNFELMSGAMAKSKIFPIGLYRRFDFKPLERIMLENRQKLGTTMIPLGNAASKILDALQNKKVVATLLDQNVDWYNGVFVDYFGQPACTNSGLAKIVLKSGAVVVPMFIIKKNGRYIHEFLPPIPLIITQDPIKDIEINTQAFVFAIESMVRQCPEQYFWMHNRWKTKPYSNLNPA